MNLTKAYRVRAETNDGDALLTVTDSRQRAERYFIALSDSRSYVKVTVELGEKVFTSMEGVP